MKRNILNILIILLFLTGVGILCYPLISNLWNQYEQDKIISGYAQAVDTLSEKEKTEIRKEAEKYNESLLVGEKIQRDESRDKQLYNALLDPEGNGVMGTIEIPKINIKLPVYHGTGETVLQKAIGHLEQSSLPVGGEGTHAVLSGHRGLASAKLFTDLDRMKKGDLFYLHVLGDILAYQVDRITVVKPDELDNLAITEGKDYVTLMTCTPYSINTHRLLVRGKRVPYEKKADAVQKRRGKSPDLRKCIILAAAGSGILSVYVIKRRKKNK